MIRKVIAYCLLVAANIALLAYTALPHHHHLDQVCLERRIHCCTDETGCLKDSPERDYHDCNTRSSACLLKQAVTIPNSGIKHLKNCDNYSHEENHDLFILSDYRKEDSQTVSGYNNLPSGFSANFKSIMPDSFGLRAPPIV